MRQVCTIRTLLYGLAICCAVLGSTMAASADLPSPPAGLAVPAKPTSMPAFKLPTTAGSTLGSESLKGEVLVIRFWASW